MAESRIGALVVVEGRQQDAFVARVEALGLRTELFGTVAGINYSRGKPTSLGVYGMASP